MNWFVAGLALGIVSLLTLRKKLGWVRTCALVAVWVVAADSGGTIWVNLTDRVLQLGATRRDLAPWEPAWRFDAFVVQAIVAISLLFGSFRRSTKR